MSRTAWIYVWGVFLSSALLIGYAWMNSPPLESLPIFFILTFLATLTQLYKAEVSGHTYYHATPLFFFAGLFLLPLSLYVLLVLIPCLIEWVHERRSNSTRLRNWYIQPFNIAMHLISGFSALEVFSLMNPIVIQNPHLSPVLAALAAALVYVSLNYLLVGVASVLIYRLPWREIGALQMEPILTELVLVCLGYVASVVWYQDRWLFPMALSPLLLIRRVLTIPQLKKEAQTDAKTGLLNARHFTRLFADEIDRARHIKRPTALILGDLDLLRDINNTYGHLAGDIVLEGIGRIIRNNIRDYDIAGRFGGEEFAIVMPECGIKEAQTLAERLRRTIESTPFVIATSDVPIHATMSFGISCFPDDARTSVALIHEADIAMYQAKLRGRNTVVCIAEISHPTTPPGTSDVRYPPMPHTALPPRRVLDSPDCVEP